jgi:hypothetical protein
MIYLLQKKTIWTIYTNVTTDSAHSVPVIANPPTGAFAITLIGPNQFMPASNPVPLTQYRVNSITFDILFEEKECAWTNAKVLRENSKKSSYKHSFRNS